MWEKNRSIYNIQTTSVHGWKMSILILISVFVEAFLISTHTICFHGEIRKISVQFVWKNAFSGAVFVLVLWSKHWCLRECVTSQTERKESCRICGSFYVQTSNFPCANIQLVSLLCYLSMVTILKFCTQTFLTKWHRKCSLIMVYTICHFTKYFEKLTQKKKKKNKQQRSKIKCSKV